MITMVTKWFKLHNYSNVILLLEGFVPQGCFSALNQLFFLEALDVHTNTREKSQVMNVFHTCLV